MRINQANSFIHPLAIKPSSQKHRQDCVPENITQTLGTDVISCSFWGQSECTPDEKNCVDHKPEEAVRIGEVLLPWLDLPICGGKAASRVMLLVLKKSMESLGVRRTRCTCLIMVASTPVSSLRKTFSSQKLYLSLAEALGQLKTMGILHSTITFPQMLEWTQTLAGINDHINTPAETMNAHTFMMTYTHFH